MVPHAIALDSLKSLAARSVSWHVPKREDLPNVLCVEHMGSPSLFKHVLALEGVRCYVRSSAPRDVPDLVVEGVYRVVVFGHTLSHADTAALAVCTKALNPGMKLVLVTGTQPQSRMMESLFDAIVPEANDPSALAMAVHRLLGCNSA